MSFCLLDGQPMGLLFFLVITFFTREYRIVTFMYTLNLTEWTNFTEAPIEELGIIKREDGRLWVDAEDGTGDNVVDKDTPSEMRKSGEVLHISYCTTDQPIWLGFLLVGRVV